MLPIEATNVNWFGLGFTILMCILVLFMPRKHALLPVLLVALYITLAQRVDILGLNFFMLRILILFGWVRILIRKELTQIKLNTIDKLIIVWVIVSIVTQTLARQTTDAFINRLGFAYNAIGLYFLFRAIIRGYDDVVLSVKMLSLVVVPLAVAMLVEKLSGRNMFGAFGGVPFVTEMRKGVLRAQGPFEHPILAGTFGATLLPLVVSLWWQRGQRILCVLGVTSTTVITMTAGSSGPVLAYMVSLGAMTCWKLRKHLSAVRWIIGITLLVLHLAMNPPVWYLLPKISRWVGGTGWHRAYLIDQAIDHFADWWLLGTDFTAHWMPTVLVNNPNMADITNHYLAEGLQGGIAKMGLFVAIIVIGFRSIGRTLQLQPDVASPFRLMVWCLGSGLLAHSASFISVYYYDQIIVGWYLILAIIAATAEAGPKQRIGQNMNTPGGNACQTSS